MSSNIRPFKSSANIVYSCKDPIVWCPKYRRKVLVDLVATRLEEIIRSTAAEKGVEMIEMEITPALACSASVPDHVQLRTRLPTLWTNSYFISTVGGAPLAVIKQYIENQKNV